MSVRWINVLAACSAFLLRPLCADEQPQYQFDTIRIPTASATEALLPEVSQEKALQYLEQGAVAWNGARKCVSCHTNGTYMTVRPALTPQLGPPALAHREHFVAQLTELTAIELRDLKKSTRPAQVIYTAAGLAEWDAHVVKSLSLETDRALRLMLQLQLESGTWGTLECWPPYESDAFHEATVAANAIATAPGWLAQLQDEELLRRVERLRQYLRTQPPPHDYGRVLLLQTSTKLTGLLDAAQQAELVERLWQHQRPDGGWSIRTFATPEAWGNGNRAAKLRAEPDFEIPESDGHQTGLAIVVLRQAGVPASDPRLQRGIAWLRTHQQVSGRWWTRSLNTDSWHFITYSGTAFPVLALALCEQP